MQGVHLRKYGVEFTIDFELYEIDGVDLRTDWVPAQADCEVMKDGGASTMCTNTATDEGSTYSIVITATEAQAARLILKIVDAVTKVFLDKVIVIETYGNASAQHAFDLDTASTPQTGDTYDLLTNDGTLAIDSLTIDSGAGDALTISGGGAAGHGIIITGSGTGAGVLSTGGPAAAGIVATGGGSSQNGFEGNGNATAGSGMLLTGGDAGLELTGTGTGEGLKVTGGSGGGAGMLITGMGSGDGVEITGGATASGIKTTAGDNAGHAGVKILGPATATGFALDLRGRGTGSHGIRALAGTDGDGIKATLDGSGADIRGDITGTIDTCTTNTDMRGTDLAFTADSGRAVAGELTALNDFDPDNDNVAVVTLVTTTTTNSDMRGTDLAFTAASGRAAVSTIDSISVDTGTTIPATLTQMQGAGFDSATDSLKSIRDRGDAAWTTGGGGSTSASVISDRVWDETVRTLTANTNLENLEVDVTKIVGSALSETSDGNIAANFGTFYDNGNALTIKTVDDVGGGAASVPPSIR